jgi:hypothetical protein
MKYIKLLENWKHDKRFEQLRKLVLKGMEIDHTDEFEAILSIAADKLGRDRDVLKIRKFSEEEFPDWQPVRDPRNGWKKSGSLNLNFVGVTDDPDLTLEWGKYPGYKGRPIIVIGKYLDSGDYRTDWIIE